MAKHRTRKQLTVFSNEEHPAKTTKLITILFLSLPCAAFAAHLTIILLLAHNKPNLIDDVSRVFTTWVPIFTGFVGPAATFYFTHERR